MKETKFRLTAPLDERGATIKLSITLENWFTLKTQHEPGYFWLLIGFFASVGFTIWFIFFEPSVIILPLFFLALFFYSLYSTRDISCVINKQNGRFYYFRSGILGTGFDQQQFNGEISGIKGVEMTRYARRGNDTFQIALIMTNGRRLRLSSTYLNFGECQEFTKKIHDFIGAEIPITTNDSFGFF